MSILITGGTGYIGSHMVVYLLERNFDCVIVDNLINSHKKVIEHIKNILPASSSSLHFHEVDISNEDEMEIIMQKYDFTSCIHFAGVKAVGESVDDPMKYYHNNVVGSYTLLKLLQKYKCRNIIFSSSCTVYGNKDTDNIQETNSTIPVNPYGRSKLVVENMLQDINISEKGEWNIDILRYFNPIGSHQSGLLHENPIGIPNNLFPYILQVISGVKDKIRVFGDTYLTKDGTGVRDYIHIMDLVEGHYVCLQDMLNRDKLNAPKLCRTYNLGTGVGTSVLDVIKHFQTVSGMNIPYSICSTRSGDIAWSVCNPDKIKKELGWTTKYTIQDAIKSVLQSLHHKE